MFNFDKLWEMALIIVGVTFLVALVASGIVAVALMFSILGI